MNLRGIRYFYHLFFVRQQLPHHWHNLSVMWSFLIFWTIPLGTMTACTSTEETPAPTLMLTAIPVHEAMPATPTIANTQISQLAVTISTPDNTKTPTPFTVTLTPTPALTPEIYEVQIGDALFKIAFAKNVNYDDFLAINDIDNPNLINPGDKLLLPSPITPTPTLSDPHIIVQAGDTLLEIAWAQDVNYIDFLAINDIDNPEWHLIKPGDILLLPPQGYFEQPDGYIPYKVKEGDTFDMIATKYGIPVEVLMNANPDIATPEELRIGSELIVPWGGIHFVAPGETLSEIAVRYEITIEDLVAANAKIYSKLSLDLSYIQAGWPLEIPSENEGDAAISDEYDCSPQPAQTGVISYTVKIGERFICLSSKFSVSEATLLNANPEIWRDGRLTDGTTVWIPPSDGALYTLTVADAGNDVDLEDIAKWYGIGEPNFIVDWQGQRVSLPIQAEQQLFIPDADLMARAFDVIVAKGLEDPIIAPTTVASNPEPNPEPGNPSQPPTAPEVPVSSGSRGIYYRWWDREYGMASPGACSYTSGAGWSSSLVWPVTGRTIYNERGFRPGHDGIDINMPIGSSVYAAASGTVIWAGYSPYGGGFIVILAHGNEWRTAYLHLSSVSVNCGAVVSQGGLIGNSGDSATYFPHVHFEVVHGNTPQDPFQWLSNEAIYVPRP